MTEVKHCPKCNKHEYQDEQHGKDMRVMNSLATKPGQATEWRCTVCEKIKQ